MQVIGTMTEKKNMQLNGNDEKSIICEFFIKKKKF